MKLQFFSPVLFVMICCQVCLGQDIDFEGNWFREIKGYDDYLSSYDFRFYTKEDVVKAKNRFNLIKQNSLKDEWEGIYTHGAMTGNAELHWSSAGGFVYFDVYHTLRRLDFGNAISRTDSVNLVSEKSSSSTKSKFPADLIKIKFGDRHFLVPENRVKDFAERAVGLSTDLDDYQYYFLKLDEVENKVFGLPDLPKRFKALLRFPINTEIIEIGKRKIHQDKFDDGIINYEEVHRFVTLGAGKNKNIKIGMNFYVGDLGEWIEITSVLQNKSTGKFRRSLDENKQEICFESERGQGQIIPCKEIKPGMKAKTKVSESYF